MFRISALFTLFIISIGTNAATVTVNLKTLEDNRLEEAVIYLTPLNPALTPPPAEAIMDQVDKQFLPHILVIQKGTKVRFPNSDSIKHHVYSFSSTKVFELRLYRDNQPAPLLFDQTGVVEMGCNIHDWMLGYIYVVDTPYFTQVGERNSAHIEVPNGEFTLSVWHPRIQDSEDTLTQNVTVNADKTITVTLKEPLLPSLNSFEDDTEGYFDYD